MRLWRRKTNAELGIHDEFPEEHFTMPANNIDPRPASEHTVHRFNVFLSVIVMATVIAVILIAITTTHTSNGLRTEEHQQDIKSQLRDTQHTQTENQIRQQQQKINILTNELRATQNKDNAAVCTLVIGILQLDQSRGPLSPPTINVVGPFLKQYNCTIPPGLLNP